jgi:2-polyprenyl-3-methyl-5-hydroxy-6-metoxy-1,4-benzoquinol methylase
MTQFLARRSDKQQPFRFLSELEARSIVARFGGRTSEEALSYATVRDYYDSLDHLSQLTGVDGDLKNVQRPWIVKAILGAVQPPARLLEIGGGEPLVSGFLSELGYDVTLIDPYDGVANGPTDYQTYVGRFPNVKIVRGYFMPNIDCFGAVLFDAIFSISVLEHIPPESLPSFFQAIAAHLRPGGASIHCFDFILVGVGETHDLKTARCIIAEQAKLANDPALPADLDIVIERLKGDVETFFLSPQGHHMWRRGRPYEEFPFRKVVSLQTVARQLRDAKRTT